MYAMMAEYKNTPLELDNTMPKELYEIVKNKWHYCMKMEKEIRETTLAQVMPDLTKGQITKANRKHSSKFAPKYKAFSILQNKIEDVVSKSTLMWKSIYKVTNDKEDETNKVEVSTKEQEEEKRKKRKVKKKRKVRKKKEKKRIKRKKRRNQLREKTWK